MYFFFLLGFTLYFAPLDYYQQPPVTSTGTSTIHMQGTWYPRYHTYFAVVRLVVLHMQKISKVWYKTLSCQHCFQLLQNKTKNGKHNKEGTLVRIRKCPIHPFSTGRYITFAIKKLCDRTWRKMEYNRTWLNPNLVWVGMKRSFTIHRIVQLKPSETLWRIGQFAMAGLQKKRRAFCLTGAEILLLRPGSSVLT